jgi:hypothetical protein
MQNIEIWIIAAATLLGPILAVQAQKWIERATERRRQKMFVFSTLMATRARRLDNDHVQALNAIELVFRGNRRANKRVIEAWRNYSDHLNDVAAIGDNDATSATWTARRDDLFIALLLAMSNALGFRFTAVEIRRGVYYPKGHGDNEAASYAIQQGLVRILSGAQPLAMKVTELPGAPEAAAVRATLAEKLSNAYTPSGALKVSIEGGDDPPSPRRSR